MTAKSIIYISYSLNGQPSRISIEKAEHKCTMQGYSLQRIISSILQCSSPGRSSGEEGTVQLELKLRHLLSICNFYSIDQTWRHTHRLFACSYRLFFRTDDACSCRYSGNEISALCSFWLPIASRQTPRLKRPRWFLTYFLRFFFNFLPVMGKSTKISLYTL